MRSRSPTASAIVGDHTRLTAMRSCAAQIRIVVTSALSTRRTRMCTSFPAFVVYGRPMISYMPVSSVSRSPIRNSIGRTRVVPGGSGCGIPGNEGWTGLAFGLLRGARSTHAESRDESSAVAPIGVFVLF